MVETALVLVIMLSLTCGVVECSLAFYAYCYVAHAARDASRFAMVRGSTCSGLDMGCPASATNVQNYVTGQNFPMINKSSLIVTTTWPGYSATGCAANGNQPGCAVQVRVQYQFPLAIPFVPAQTLTMASSSQVLIAQ